MHYYISICSTHKGKQQLVVSEDGSITADSKEEVYEMIFAHSYLEEIFRREYPTLAYDKLHVLFCKVY